MSEQTIEELRAALDKEREEHEHSKNANEALARENEALKNAVNQEKRAHEVTKVDFERLDDSYQHYMNVLHDVEIKLKRTKATLKRTKTTLAQTEQALATTQAALTLAHEARDDAQAFQMTGFY